MLLSMVVKMTESPITSYYIVVYLRKERKLILTMEFVSAFQIPFCLFLPLCIPVLAKHEMISGTLYIA